MNLLRLICLLSVCCLLGAAQAVPPIPATHPEQIGGRWETVTPSGIQGIGFEIMSQSSGSPNSEHFVFQNVNAWVYTRENGKEKGGYFSGNYWIKPRTGLLPDQNSFEAFDGRHLRIHFTNAVDAQPFDLDIAFVPKANKWIGTWSHSGNDERVTLIRPEGNTGAESNKFVGKWVGVPSPDSEDESTTLNIRQSSDGVVSAWLDQTFSCNRRNGAQLNIESISDSAIVFKTNNSTGVPDEFRGSLSPDGRMLTGKWGRLGDGGQFGAAEKFRRAPDMKSQTSHH